MSLLKVYEKDFNKEDNLKKEIQEIVRSYRHSWDIFSETLQNAVDAIVRRYKILNDPNYSLYQTYRERFGNFDADHNYRGKITIIWDASEAIVEIHDNGIGFEPAKMEQYLLPRGTGKLLGQDYGFKGYGLTFAAFISEQFSIKSRFIASNETYYMSLDKCFDWLAKDNAFPNSPIPEPKIVNQNHLDDAGTVVRLKLAHNYQAHFPALASLDATRTYVQKKADIDRLVYILRSRTAIGNTRYLFSLSPEVPIDIELRVLFPDSEEKRDIPFRYYHPKEHNEVSVLAYDMYNYVENLKRASFKRDFRALYHPVPDQRVGTLREIKFDVALCAVSSTRLANIESKLRLNKIETTDVNLCYGIHLAINGMPTGLRIDDWDERGNWLKRYFVIVDAELGFSDQLDSGRKGISRHFAKLISDKVLKLISETRVNDSDTFAHYALAHMDTGRVVGRDIYEDDFYTILENIDEQKGSYDTQERILLKKIKKYSSLERLPSTELEVIALYYHLTDRGIIKGYTTQYLSSIATYDAGMLYSLELTTDNLAPENPLGIAKVFYEKERSKGRSVFNVACYRRNRPELCIEFKKSIGNFLEEIRGKTAKEPDIIDILICWDDSIPSSVQATSYTLDPIDDTQRQFYGTTHRLGLIGAEGGNTEVDCIVLRDVLNNLP